MYKRYFHTFDALRFFAFLKVFFLHLPLVGFPLLTFFKAGGGIGVQFFFVLSGFLITYLLTSEKQKLRAIHFNKFFTRRVLRIWPLYFFLLLVSAVIAYFGSDSGLNHNSDGYSPNWWMSVFFLENYHMMITHKLPELTSLSVTWSVCIEEHFYLFWALMFVVLKFRHIPDFLFLAFIIGPVARWLYQLLGGYADLDLFTNMDLFAAGSLLGWGTARNHPIIQKLNRVTNSMRWSWIVLTIVIVIIYPHSQLPGKHIWGPFVMAILFTGVLATLLNPEKTFGISNNSPFTALGKYTYGLYLTHVIVIQAVRFLFIKIDLDLALIPNAILYFVIVLILCLLVARISYLLLEEPFLNLKKYFYALDKENNGVYKSYRPR